MRKCKINEKEVFVTDCETINYRNNYTEFRRQIYLFMKINTNKRFHFGKGGFSNLINQNLDFEDMIDDYTKGLEKYDAENYNALKDSLSEEFYFNNFALKEKSIELELDEDMKRKLIEISQKYPTKFYAACKDNLLRIEVEINPKSSINKYERLYNVEKVFEELINMFLEFERVEENLKLNNIVIDKQNIKNIILDIDNILILNSEADSEYFREALINSGENEDYFDAVYQGIKKYEDFISEDNPYYNENEMLKFVNELLGQNFSIDMIKEINHVIGNEWTKRVIVFKDTLDYLAGKYNLYIYTNYFQDVQKERIKNIGYIDYFKEILGADKYGCKQYCFKNVLQKINTKLEECIVITSDNKKDIDAARSINTKTIILDYNGNINEKEININEFYIINDMNELKKIL